MARQGAAQLLLAALFGITARAVPGPPDMLAGMQTPSSGALRVACVGDSLTAGFHASFVDRSYPSVLQRLLGSEYYVMNFGHSGATLTGPQADWPAKIVYSHTEEYTQSLQSEPDLVIIMLGSNDATQMVWPTFRQDFEPAYGQLVGVYQSLPTKPTVLVAVPPPLYRNHAYGMLQSVINAEFPSALQRIANSRRLPPPVSIFEAFKAKCPNLQSNACPFISGVNPLSREAHDDGCHPNDAGYSLIAERVHDAILPMADRLLSLKIHRSYDDGIAWATQPHPAGAHRPSPPQARPPVPGVDIWAKRRRLLAEGKQAPAVFV